MEVDNDYTELLREFRRLRKQAIKCAVSLIKELHALYEFLAVAAFDRLDLKKYMEKLRQYYYSKGDPARLNAKVLKKFDDVSFELQKFEYILIDFTETPEAVAMDIEEASHRYTDESKKRKRRRFTDTQISQKVALERK